MSNLEELILSESGISGSIPTELALLTALETLEAGKLTEK